MTESGDKPMTCPLCGHNDTTGVAYDDRRRELRVEHTDEITCSASPVDTSGQYLQDAADNAD